MAKFGSMKANDNCCEVRDLKGAGIPVGTTMYLTQVINTPKIEELFGRILTVLGFDWAHDHNLQGTPKRVARMYSKELFAGCYTNEPSFTVFPNVKKVDEIVYLKDISLKSVCAHHFLPFTGRVHIGYLPNAKLCGVSKLARTVDWFARRPQIQEELTAQIAGYLMDKLKPKGVAVVVEAAHQCMLCRGVNEFESKMGTSSMLGVFRKNPAARDEFLRLIGK